MPIASGIYYFANEPENWARPAVLLIHGAGGTHLDWPPEIRRLEGQRIYALDLPGHGKSEGFGLQTIEDYARAVLNFMDALKIRKAVFVGHSMGGAIALYLGVHNPSRTLGLGLIASGPRLRVSPALLEKAETPATFAMATQFLAEMAFGPQADQRLKDQSTERMAEMRPAVLHGDLLACNAYDEAQLLGRIKAPTLIICGTADKMTPLHLSEQLNTRIKNTILCTVESAGHMLMLEEPQKVAAPLLLFLNGISYQPGEAA
ncbi:MAG: alpha/beta hydrolase [Anaerolineales bacterium]|jgi:pimeloyl-ACP methyl ester carboxylesterase|nr:alpha/beta hydrolase [Anaerolineales bacterium]